MAKAITIIEAAFSKAEIRAEETPLTEAMLARGLDVLNDLLASWNATGTLPGVDLISDVNNDDVKAPRHALWALKANVAILVAPEYGKQISQGLAYDASHSLEELQKAQATLAPMPYPSTLPTGSGNQGADSEFYRTQYYPADEEANF